MFEIDLSTITEIHTDHHFEGEDCDVTIKLTTNFDEEGKSVSAKYFSITIENEDQEELKVSNFWQNIDAYQIMEKATTTSISFRGGSCWSLVPGHLSCREKSHSVVKSGRFVRIQRGLFSNESCTLSRYK